MLHFFGEQRVGGDKYMRKARHIMHPDRRGIGAFFKGTIIMWSAFMSFNESATFAQVITNQGAAISLTPGIVVGSKDMFNNAGSLLNNGTLNLSGNYTSGASFGGDGFYRLGGNWTITGGIFDPGLSTVVFNGIVNQIISRTGGITFHNLTISNTGTDPANRVGISNNVTVGGILAMASGNIDAAAYILNLANPAAAALSYTSVTGSRILGRFERGINQTDTYLFPLGTSSFYNPAKLKPNNIVAAGSVLSQFITSPSPGNAGLPIPDPPVEIAVTYPDGFWSMTAKNSFSSDNFNINLNATGFTDTVWSTTRLIKRSTGGNWTVDGIHQVVDTVNNVVFRNNLTGNISPLGTEFALGRAHPLITSHPDSLIVCEGTNPVFSVTATGAERLRYAWYKDGVLIVNGSHYSGARTSSLTIIGAVLSDAGNYYCIVTDRYRNSTTSNSAYLQVNKIPVAFVTPGVQNHECSGIPFEDIVMDLNYWDPGTTFLWTREDKEGIITSIPLDGSAANIGDVLSGSFTDTTDAPIEIKFTITPVGPAPTFCVGLPVQASVTVNPTPKVIVDQLLSHTCYGTPISLTLTSPTIMTQGEVKFDYFINVTGLPGEIVGNTAPATDVNPGTRLTFPYANNADTINSVFFTITPKNEISGCNSGEVVIPRVKVHPRPLRSVFISTPFTCTGGSEGVVTAILSRGSKPDIIKWSNRPWLGDTIYPTTENYTSLPIHYAGRYPITITDSLGCYSTMFPGLEVLGVDFETNVYVNDTTGFGTTCPGSADGEIRIWEGSTTTAIPPYVYWLVRNGQDTLRHDTIFAVGELKIEKNLPSGLYDILIKDNNGCINTEYPQAEITEPMEISVTFGKSDYHGFNVSCKGYNDGSVWIESLSGGNGHYSFLWETTDGLITGPDNTDRLDNIPAGTYILTTTDRKGCFVIDTVHIEQPAGMSLDGYRLSYSADSAWNISCNGGNDGSIELDVTGGAAPYNYFWTDSATYTASTRDINNLEAGTYVVKVTDQNNCELRLQPTSSLPAFVLTEPAPLDISALTSSANGGYNINCFGGMGSIDISVTGGSEGNYKYFWSIVGNGSGIVPDQEDQWLLTEGTYKLIVRDSNLCEVDTTITLTQPDPVETMLIPTHITCLPAGFANGSVDLTISGGVAPYGNIMWSNGETTEDISGLSEGHYKVTLTDANACPVIDSVRVNLPPPLLFRKELSTYNGFNVSCYGSDNGSINITPESGLAPYNFSWSNGAVTEDITGLTAGQYTLTITDANMCQASETIDIIQPGNLYMNISESSSIAGGFNINCAGDNTGSIDLVPVNQVGSVGYLWADGAFSATRMNVPAGEYSVIITDENNCRADTTVILKEPDSLKIVFNVKEPWCPDKPDGEISLTVTGGVPGADYTYRWSDNSSGSNITNIVSGEFKVTVSDLNGCTISDSVRVSPQKETCLDIPNAISPNNDAINDKWNIGLIELYPDIEIKIFNRWGEIVWRSEKGYPQPWDGMSNGKPLPIDSYHYIIDMGNGRRPVIGNVTIVR